MIVSKSNQTTLNQSGMASIIVTMIMMIIISLIVLAAAQLARRGQRQTLDRQLSTQAFYAAESGVNDAVKAIAAQLAATPAGDPAPLADNDHTSTCNGPGSFIVDADPDLVPLIDATSQIEYTCLLVDPTPTTWEGEVGDMSRTTPIREKLNGSIGSITIAWQSKDGNSDFAGCPAANFEPETGPGARSCKTPVLRFDLVSTANKTRTWLNDNVMTGFLVPIDGGEGGISFAFDVSSSPGDQTGSKRPVDCDALTTPKFCKATITVPAGTGGYYLRMKSIYGTASVSVSASAGITDATKVELKDSQIVVDSTGRAFDILRRIQVRVPFGGVLDMPEFAIQSGDSICKQLNVTISAVPANADPACGL